MGSVSFLAPRGRSRSLNLKDTLPASCSRSTTYGYTSSDFTKRLKQILLTRSQAKRTKITSLDSRQLKQKLDGEWSDIYSLERFNVVCPQCGSIYGLTHASEGLCSTRCLRKMTEREQQALEQARQKGLDRTRRGRIPQNPNWAGSGSSVHTVPGPGPTQ